MKSQETVKENESQKARPSFHCEDLQKMAKAFRPGEADAFGCCSSMMRMRGRCKEKEGKKRQQAPNPKRRK